MTIDQTVIAEFLDKAKHLNLDRWCASSGESLEDLAIRFLRARRGKVSDALLKLEEDVKWRVQEAVDSLPARSVKEISGLDEKIIQSYIPNWIQGYDKKGRPVMYTAYGNFEVDTLMKKGTTVEKLLLLHIRSLERKGFVFWHRKRTRHAELLEH